MNRYLISVRDTLAMILASLPILISANSITLDDGPLACSNEINVSVNATCGVDISAESLLEGAYDPGTYVLQIEQTTGVYADLSDVRTLINKRLKYIITNSNTGQSCWGHITLEDKTAPIIDCDSCTDPLVSDPNCVMNCAELPLFNTFHGSTGTRGYDQKLLDRIIPSDPESFLEGYVSDNCDQSYEAHYIDFFTNGDCSTSTLLTRRWIISYDTYNGQTAKVECDRYYRFDAISIFDVGGDPIIEEGNGTPVEDIILMPPTIVIVPNCGSGYSPAEIAAHFDDPTTSDYDSDNDGIDPEDSDIDCVIENNEGIWYAYPHLYLNGLKSSNLHAQPLSNDLCSVNVSYTDVVIEACSPECGGNVKVSRVWTILDWCTSTSFQHRQIIEVVDQVAPVMEIVDVNASVDPWECAATVLVPHPKNLFDLCTGPVSYSVKLGGTIVDISGDHQAGYVINKLSRGIYNLIYTAEDCCGNVNQQTVALSVDDRTPPVPVVKQNLVVDMAPTGIVNIPDRGIAKVYASDIDNGSYDSCSDVIVSVRRKSKCMIADTVWGDFVRFCCEDLVGTNSQSIDVEFRVMDWDGNVNFSNATILLEDKGVAASCPLDMVLDCDQDIWDYELTGVPTSQTSCEDIPILIDTTETNMDTEPRKKSASVGAVPGYIGVAVDAYDPACGFGAMRRRWHAGGQVICTQWFVIEPGINVFDPESISFPDDVRVTCSEYETGQPSWLGGSCNLIGLTLQSDTIRIGGEACVKIVNEWAVINWCTYDASDPDLNDQIDPNDDGEVPGRYVHHQIIEVNDDTYPTIVTFDDRVIDVNNECESKGVTFSAIADDEGECASPWLAWHVRVDLNDDWVIEHTYSHNVRTEINGEPNPYFLEKTASGHAINITIPDGIAASKNRHRIDWLVNDGCDNVTEYRSYFTIEDTKAPTPYCLNLGTSVMENGRVELWAIDFNVGSFDNCTPSEELYYTFTDVPPPPRCDDEFDSQIDLQWYDGTYWFYDSSEGTDDPNDRDCPLFGEGAYSDGGYNPATGTFEEYENEIHRWEPGLRSSGKVFTTSDVGDDQHVEIPIYTWDECENIDFCIVRLRIIDNGGGAQGLVAGVVKTEDAKVVEEVMTQLVTDLPEYPKYSMTDNTGSFSFEENMLTHDYRLTASKDDDHLNGVSTVDLIKIQRHILGIEMLDSPYKMIAADINNDKRINGQDLVELRKLILGIYTELPQNDSWILMDSKSTMTMSDPWLYSEDIMIEEMLDNKMEQDFVGVKIGDVNNSVIASTLQEVINSSSSTAFTFEDLLVQAGEEVEVSFNTETAAAGYQLALNVEGLDVIDVLGKALDKSNFVISGSKITLSVDTDETEEKKENSQFTLKVKAIKAGLLSDMIGVSNGRIQSEVYIGRELEVSPIELLRSKSYNEFSMGQNEPNPFSSQTTINYALPHSSQVTVSFYDVNGRLLHQLNRNAQKGENRMIVDSEDLTTGVVYYKLQAGDYSAVRSMIIIE